MDRPRPSAVRDKITFTHNNYVVNNVQVYMYMYMYIRNKYTVATV